MQREAFVTFSVDDGDPSDLRAADLLQKYGLKATFYIPERNAERAVMAEHQIQDISRRFEIGAHTLNHVRLTAVSREQAWTELRDGKKWVEDLTGQPARSFCYPGGKFDHYILKLVEQAGYSGARSCMFNLTNFPQNPFLWGVSTHAHSHTRLVQLRHALLEKNLAGAWNFVTVFAGKTDWLEHFLSAVKQVSERGGIAHLYFHSWEIDQFKDWARLESAFDAVGKMPNLVRVTNGELFAMPSQLQVLRAAELS